MRCSGLAHMSETLMSEAHDYQTQATVDAAYALAQESGLSYLSCLAIIEARQGK